MQLVDICVNLTNTQFRDQQQQIIERAARAGVDHMLLTGTDLVSSEALLGYAHEFKRRTTAGIHPHDAASAPDDWLTQLIDIASHPLVAAVGETGLDFNRNFSPKTVQQEVFEAQIALAQQLKKPLFVHDRDSQGLVAECLTRAGALPPVVIHCFTGTPQELDRYLSDGYYIGITGWIADHRRGEQLRNLVADIPLQRLLLETDAPFLRPQNVDKQTLSQLGIKRRNEPALLPFVLQAVAASRPESDSQIAAQTTQNAQDLFHFRTDASVETR